MNEMLDRKNYYKSLYLSHINQLCIILFFSFTLLFSYIITSPLFNMNKSNIFIYLFICCLFELIICFFYIKIDKINILSSINLDMIEYILFSSMLNIIKFFLIIKSSSLLMPIEISNILYSIPIIYQVLLNDRSFRLIEIIFFSMNLLFLLNNYNVFGFITGFREDRIINLVYPSILSSIFFFENKLNSKLYNTCHFYIITIISCIIGLSILPLFAVLDIEIEIELNLNTTIFLFILSFCYFNLSYNVFNFHYFLTIHSFVQILSYPFLYMINFFIVPKDISIFIYMFSSFICCNTILEKNIDEEYLSYDIDNL